jgi:prepilin-type N-terminal cleavage/methylation domain-containing protein
VTLPHRRSSQRAGFSLVEILAGSVIIALLAGVLLVGVSGSRSASRMARCLGNLRQIHQTLMLYHAEHHRFAVPSESLPLKQMLAPWMDSSDAAFHCPDDPDPASDSYSYFYVPRSLLTGGADRYVLGCSRHHHHGRGVAVFSGMNAETFANAPVTLDDTKGSRPVLPGEVLDHGTLRFADGSTVAIVAGQGGNAGGGKAELPDEGRGTDRASVRVLHSGRLPTGRVYTVIGIEQGALGTVQVDVQPDNRFEVSTPAAVIAVRGTQFQVTTLRASNKPATRVEVTVGEVDMEPVGWGHGIRLKAGGASKGYAVQGQEPVYE